MDNPYDLSDEELYGGEPTWEQREIEELKNKIEKLEEKLEDADCKIKMAVECINNFSVDKSFSFPLMKRWEENQVKASIDYEFNDTLKKNLLKILSDQK